MADEKNTAKREKNFKDALEKARLRGMQAHAESDKAVAETPQQMFLPGFDIGAMPNHLNRSSFISPVARGKRKHHQQTEMVTRADCVLEYTGQQLDEADGDLLMALIFFAKDQPLGTMVRLNRSALLKKIKRNTGKSDYEWLYRRLKAMREGVLFLEARKPDGSTKYSVGKMTSFNILKELEYGETNEYYAYMLDPRWVVLYGNREYGLIDFDKRMEIGRGMDMAKALQRLVSTSSNKVQHYALDKLKDKMQYGGRMRDFKDSIDVAVAELVRLEIIAKGKIETSTKDIEQLTLWLMTSG